ncbi:hypothetical protein EV201_0864 [Ancylomarina subtilis]|uniref:Uncharacterized protein n=1 Tax=Ancylomarina subtilis TaxID=1639035 RepID=A0A4Q7VJQ2_9BACT|nr:hypothetical protein [Ancylomarina subtilis]RZT96228.1 hypothetical protein EV201_0864 [Ancylomarina subtilis]
MNKKLNLWYFIVSIIILIVMRGLEMYSLMKVDINIYYTIIGTSIAALGNYVVIRIQNRNVNRKTNHLFK